MLSAAAPAATWGAGVPLAGQQANLSPSQSVGAATPSPINAAGLGMMKKGLHKKGLQSGGLLGYSTFFTGYNPSRGDNLGRQLSIGRLAAQGVSTAAKGLNQTPLSNTAAGELIDRATKFSKHGLGAFVSPDQAAGSKSGLAHQRMKSHPQYSSGLKPIPQAKMKTGGATRNLVKNDFFKSVDSGPLPGTTKRQLRGAKVVGTAGKGVQESAEAIGKSAAVEEAAESSWLWKTMGMLGGKGYNDTGGKVAANAVKETIGDKTYDMLSARGKGMNMMPGKWGAAAGAAIKLYGAYEVLKLAVDAGTYAAGQAYESAVESTETMMQRVGRSDAMSKAYYNRAAATERQRAVQELNDSTLNPRTQLMGNEATYMR